MHAELNILANIINSKDKSKIFIIAVSKKCCYLCELFIEFAQENGYNVEILGKNKKLYWNWKLLNIVDANFMNKYIMNDLDMIIKNRIRCQLDKLARSNRDDYYFSKKLSEKALLILILTKFWILYIIMLNIRYCDYILLIRYKNWHVQ